MVADQWRADPSLLFNTSKKCVEEVRKGNRVYPNVKLFTIFHWVQLNYHQIILCHLRFIDRIYRI